MERPRRTLTLTDQQRAELEWARDRHPKPYLRERAAALLKIAGGQSPHAVALGGLLKPRHPQTVYAWLNRYRSDGKLSARPACRRAFSP
jgi:transposase